ncbi:MAG: T9SS type A sorting domain-containing protein [Lentimicrobiaceae bacterium]|nr:T9SS type A sorting domain-containing protein [Lentimicrobiaceae bacterium]
MKKSLFTLTAILLFIGAVFAQPRMAPTKVDMPKPETPSFTATAAHAPAQHGRDVVYAEGFEGTSGIGGSLPTGWTVSATGTWKTYSNLNDMEEVGGDMPAKEGTRFMGRSWLYSGNTWAFSNGFTLTAGETYSISFWWCAMGYQQGGEVDKFEVRIGQTATAAAMASAEQVFANTTIWGWDYTWRTHTSTFTPTASGTYYLGIHDQNAAEYGLAIMIDDIKVESGGTPPPPDCDPAKNLAVTYTTDCKADLTWTAPAKNKGDQWLTYVVGDFAGGVGVGGPAELSFAQRWSPSDLANLGIVAGNKISKMKFYFSEGPYNSQTGQTYIEAATYEFKIWQGSSSTSAGTEIYSSPSIASATLVSHDWHEISLSTPVEIDPSLELWLGVHVNMTAGAGPPCPYGTGGFVQNVNMLLYNGSWAKIESLITNPVFNSGNWAIQGFVEGQGGPVLNYYNVYRDNGLIKEKHNTTSYTDAGFVTTEGHTWEVAVVCPSGESDKIEKILPACATACDPITNGAAAVACETATITWTAVEGATGYKVSRSGVLLSTVTTPQYVENGDFENGKAYTWEVITVCSTGEATPVNVTGTAACEGVHETGLQAFTIAPNPATSNEITIKAGVDFHSVEVVNFLGQTVISQFVNANEIKIDISALTNGVYFVRLASEKGTCVKKFVKQ